MRRWLRDQDGGVAIIAAAALTGGVGLAALAVDLGSVYLQSRRLQGVADLAAGARQERRGRRSGRACAYDRDVPLGLHRLPLTRSSRLRFVHSMRIDVAQHSESSARYDAGVRRRTNFLPRAQGARVAKRYLVSARRRISKVRYRMMRARIRLRRRRSFSCARRAGANGVRGGRAMSRKRFRANASAIRSTQDRNPN